MELTLESGFSVTTENEKVIDRIMKEEKLTTERLKKKIINEGKVKRYDMNDYCKRHALTLTYDTERYGLILRPYREYDDEWVQVPYCVRLRDWWKINSLREGR